MVTCSLFSQGKRPRSQDHYTSIPTKEVAKALMSQVKDFIKRLDINDPILRSAVGKSTLRCCC